MNLSDCKEISKTAIQRLKKQGFENSEDLLLNFPKKYEDLSNIKKIYNTIHNEMIAIQGYVTNIFFGAKTLKFTIYDNSAYCYITLFNYYPEKIKDLKKGSIIRCYGKVTINNGFINMIHPKWAIVNNDGTCDLELKVLPIYNFYRIADKKISQIILNELSEDKIENLLPLDFLKQFNIMNYKDSLYYQHALVKNFDFDLLEKAQYSIKFQEMLAYKLADEKANENIKFTKSYKLVINEEQQKKFNSRLEYQLTNAQKKVMQEIKNDISFEKTMIRLLQGDVGAGKTIVATLALYICAKSNFQSVFMAPTEILAEQHYQFLTEYFKDFNIEIISLLGKHTQKETNQKLKKISQSNNCIVVGTHSVFQEKVKYNNLGLVIIDEQHRFGVEQRLALLNKSDKCIPHQLIISATPIPRTLSMAVYGNIKLSVLDELPPHKKPIDTKILNREKKNLLIERLKNSIEKGEQIYWVCPLVDESNNLSSLQDVKTLHEELKESLQTEKIGLVYGSMKSKEKTSMMTKFKNKEFNILVATTVIEVGVDVPNATIIIIDNSERLGISQLHQLRGRVGRGIKKSYCILLYDNKITKIGRQRLSLIRESQDGFYLAEQDLKIRGAGNVLGKEQSGNSIFKTFEINEYYDNYQQVLNAIDYIKENHQNIIPPLITRWFKDEENYIDV